MKQAFSANEKDTLTTLDPKYQDRIGKSEGLSFRDVKLANLMYKCNSKFKQQHSKGTTIIFVELNIM